MAHKTIKISISGLTCVNCSSGIEKFISKKDGVKSAKVSFASNEGEFIINTSKYSKEELINDIEQMGYLVQEDSKALEQEQLKVLNSLKVLLIFSFILTIGIFTASFSNLLEKNLQLLAIFIMATLVQFVVGFRFYKLAYKALSHRNYDMNVLVVLGTTAAYGYSSFVVFFPELLPSHLQFMYFDGAAVIISFVLLGKYLEENSKQKASDFLKKLMNLVPQTANLLKEDQNIEVVKSSSLKIGDKILVKVGETIPSDGIIIEGSTYLNTSTITGESLPIFKDINDEVLSGSVNTNSVIVVQVQKEASNTTLSKIIHLLKSAQSKQIPISRFADKVSNIFVPSVIFISIVTFILWALFGSIENAIIASISVLIISCPCALGLATPIAIVSSVSKGAKEGILIKNPEILEIIKEIKYAVFDKTGTLTTGKIEVKQTDIPTKYFCLIATIEKYSEHPISKAIVKYVEEKEKLSPLNIKNIEVVSGKGIKAVYEDQEVLIGNKQFLKEHDVIISNAHRDFYNNSLSKGLGAVIVSLNKESLGSFILEDTLKQNAKNIIKELKNRSIIPVLLTGDNKLTANSVGNYLGITKIYSEVLPHEKYSIIQKLQEEAKLMFIGDGVNDAPSIKKANIGIALNSGSDIAKDAGDIIIVNNDLKSIIKSISLSIETLKTIKQNLFWAFFYNVVGIPIAAGVLYPIWGVMLTPMYAGIAMSFSSLTVILNSLRLKMKDLNYKEL